MFERFLNPVLVREMRQAVRNRLVMVMLCLYLLLLVAACMEEFFLHLLPFGKFAAEPKGERLFFHILYITFSASAVTVVLYTAGRLISERMNEDMMYVSTLRPMTIALGKLGSGVMITLLFHCVTLPFVTLVYELRGVDITVMFGCLLISFLMIQTLNAMVLGFFCGIRTVFDVVIRTIPFFLCAWLFIWMNCDCWRHFFFRSSQNILENLLAIVIIGGFMFVLIPVTFLLLAACQLASPLSNRMFLTRHIMTWFGLLSLVVCVFFNLYFQGSVGHIILVWTLFAMYPCVFFCTIAACERDYYGLRLRTTIPQSLGRRLYAFPFYTGDCNAFVWLVIWITIAFSAYLIGILFIIDPFYQNAFPPLFSTILFSFNYSVLAVAIRYPLRRWISKDQTWIIIAILLSIGFLLPFLFLVGTNNILSIQSNWYNYLILVPNPIWIYQPSGSLEEKSLQLTIAGIWFLLTLPFVALWMKRRFKEFVRYEIPSESPLITHPLADPLADH